MARSNKKTFAKLPQFAGKIISKTTEVKNLVTQIQNLTTQKAALEANNQSTAEVQAQLTQKQNTLAKKVVKTETKVNSNALAVTIQKISSSLISSAIANRLSDSDYIDIQGFNTGAINVGSYKINNKSLTNFGSINEGYSPNYKYATFNINTSGSSTLFIISPYSKNGILAIHANAIASGESFLTNLIPYLRDDAWIVWDRIENTVFYNFNIRQSDSMNYMPLKGWVRNNLFKTSIELIEVLNAASPGSSSGSGSGSGSGAVGSIGLPILEEIFNSAEQIVWDYAYDTPEIAINYDLKKVANNPIIPDDIQNKIDLDYFGCLIIHKAQLVSNNISYLNYRFIKRQNPLNSSIIKPLPREGNISNSGESYIISSAAGLDIDTSTRRILAIEERESLGSPLRKYVDFSNFDATPPNKNEISSRLPIKVQNGSYPYFFEVYENGRVWQINYGTDTYGEIEYYTSTQLNQIANGGLLSESFSVYQPSVYKDKFYADGPAPATVTPEYKIRLANITNQESNSFENIFSIDDIKKIVGSRSFGQFSAMHILLNNGDLYFYGDGNFNNFVLCDSSIEDITYNYEWSQVVGITTNYDLKRFTNNNLAGVIHGERKYKKIGKRFAIQHFA